MVKRILIGPAQNQTTISRPVKKWWLSKRWRKWIWIGAVFVTVSGGYKIRLWWVSPEHRLAQFAAAVSRGDAAAMMALADATEVRRLGLTPEKITAMLEDAARSPGGVAIGDITLRRLNERQSGYNRLVQVTLTGLDGKPSLGPDGKPARAFIYAYNTDAGWKVGLSYFLYSITVAKSGMSGRKAKYRTLCLQHTIPAEIFDPVDATWIPMPSDTGNTIQGEIRRQ